MGHDVGAAAEGVEWVGGGWHERLRERSASKGTAPIAAAILASVHAQDVHYAVCMHVHGGLRRLGLH